MRIVRNIYSEKDTQRRKLFREIRGGNFSGKLVQFPPGGGLEGAPALPREGVGVGEVVEQAVPFEADAFEVAAIEPVVEQVLDMGGVSFAFAEHFRRARAVFERHALAQLAGVALRAEETPPLGFERGDQDRRVEVFGDVAGGDADIESLGAPFFAFVVGEGAGGDGVNGPLAPAAPHQHLEDVGFPRASWRLHDHIAPRAQGQQGVLLPAVGNLEGGGKRRHGDGRAACGGKARQQAEKTRRRKGNGRARGKRKRGGKISRRFSPDVRQGADRAARRKMVLPEKRLLMAEEKWHEPRRKFFRSTL